MHEYLIEVPHAPDECCSALVGAADSPRQMRSYRGCQAGTHTTWVIGELADETEAWALVPPLLRDTARVIAVTSHKKGEPE